MNTVGAGCRGHDRQGPCRRRWERRLPNSGQAAARRSHHIRAPRGTHLPKGTLMKSIKLGTRTLALAVCLSCALPLAAQTTTGTGGATGTGGTTGGAMSTTTGTDTTARRDSGFDWGWLGLIGLAG